MILPTSRLPPIKRIPNTAAKDLNDCIDFLRVIYNPEVRGSRRRNRLNAGAPEPKILDEVTSHAELDKLRTDPFERSYAIKWMTVLVSVLSSEYDMPTSSSLASNEASDIANGERLLQKTASLLSICAGTASAGEIVRNFVFQTQDIELIRVDLKDVPLDNQDYGSVGAQTWGGACVLAEMIVDKPHEFGLPSSATVGRLPSGKTTRVVELGAGTGLVSLAAAKTIEKAAIPEGKVELVATDYYPSVLENLKANVGSNFPSTSSDALDISACFLDWSSFCFSTDIPSQLTTPFDVAYGADIIYEALHAQWIKACLGKLLRRPADGDEDPLFHLVIPLRSTHTSESSTIEQVFPKEKHDNPKGQKTEMELVIKYKEDIICEAESGKDGDEVVYSYYKIGWGWS